MSRRFSAAPHGSQQWRAHDGAFGRSHAFLRPCRSRVPAAKPPSRLGPILILGPPAVRYDVSVLAQHKHTSYLIQHGRLRGFAPEEVLALAAVARYGGRGYPKSSHKPFGSLSPKRRDRVVKLAVILRLAAALDRGRAQVVDSVDVELSGGRLRLQLRSDRNCELELWATSRQASLLERVFGRRLDLASEVQARIPQISFESAAASAR